MKKHELDAAIAAAEAELARLRAMKPEMELHPMTLPLERGNVRDPYSYICSGGVVEASQEDGYEVDEGNWNTANYYASEEQAARYADAFEVMRLMRRQPGIVDPSKSVVSFLPVVNVEGAVDIFCVNDVSHSACMFPCFESQQAAEAAVAAVGAERLVHTSNWLAGVVG